MNTFNTIVCAALLTLTTLTGCAGKRQDASSKQVAAKTETNKDEKAAPPGAEIQGSVGRAAGGCGCAPNDLMCNMRCNQ